MSIDEDVLLCIPARGGSKRLKRKNVANLCGRPMISYTIEAAQNSGLSNEVWVCTEDHEIASIAEAEGARVQWLSDEITQDEVSSTEPCLVLADGLEPDYLFNLQPSSPLRNGNDVRRAFEVLRNEGADFVVSVTAIDPHYFHWALCDWKTGSWSMYFGKDYLKERPQLPPVFRPNGAIKGARYEAVKRERNFFGENLAVCQMPEERSVHVAEKFDLALAENLLGGIETNILRMDF